MLPLTIHHKQYHTYIERKCGRERCCVEDCNLECSMEELLLFSKLHLLPLYENGSLRVREKRFCDYVC